MNSFEEYAQFDFVSLEGYVVGRVAIEALKNAGADPTRDSFLHALEAMENLDLGGLVVGFGPDDHQGIGDVFMTRLLPDGFFEPL
jgi:ABC-type branched-subunit amino acid transport system substrate-binding protein